METVTFCSNNSNKVQLTVIDIDQVVMRRW